MELRPLPISQRGEELLLGVDVLIGVKTPPSLPEGEELLLGVDVLIGVKTPPGLPEGEELLLGDNVLIGVKPSPLRGGREGLYCLRIICRFKLSIT